MLNLFFYLMTNTDCRRLVVWRVTSSYAGAERKLVGRRLLYLWCVQVQLFAKIQAM